MVDTYMPYGNNMYNRGGHLTISLRYCPMIVPIFLYFWNYYILPK